MKTSVKFLLLSFFIFFFFIDTNFAIDLWLNKVDPSLKNANNDFVLNVESIVATLVGLLYLIAVIFAIYGWFLILTSAGDDEKVKKWKNIVIYMVIGLIVVFLASTLVNWVIDTMQSNKITWNTIP